MKKKVFYYLFAVLCLATAFTACSDDDDEVVNPISGSVTYTSAKGLTLTYNGEPLPGKQVTFTADPNDGRKAVLRLEGEPMDLTSALGRENNAGASWPSAPGVFPGTPVVELPVTVDINGDLCTFSGTSETDFCTYNYKGEASPEKFTLALSGVKLKNTLLANSTWSPVPLAEDYSEEPVHLVWESGKQIELFPGFGMDVQEVVLLALRMPLISAGVDGEGKPMTVSPEDMLCTVLKDVTLKEDGNLIATYMDAANGGKDYVVSPANIAQYVIAGEGRLLLFLNPQAIMANVKTVGRAAGITDPAFVQQVMNTLLPLLKSGIPVIYLQEGDRLTVCLDTDLLLPLLKNFVAPLFQSEEFINLIVSSMGPDMESMASLIVPALKSVPEIIEKTTKIEIGLNLKK